MRHTYLQGLGWICRILLAGWLAVGAAAWADTSVDQGRAEGYYKQAVTDLKKGDAKAAIIQLRNALQQDGRHRGARLLLGELYLRSGDPLSAEKELRRAHEQQADDQSEILLGSALERLGRFDEVLQLVGEDAAGVDLRHDKLLVRARAELGLKQFDAAEALLHRALDLKPDSPAALFEQARVAEGRGDFAASRRHLEAVLRGQPKWLEAWLFKAAIEQRLHQYETAMADLEQASAISPDNLQLLLMRAQLLMETGRPLEAEKILQDILKREPKHPKANFMLAAIKLLQNDAQAASKALFVAENALADAPEVLLLGALVRQQIGEPAQAEQNLTRYLALRPDDTNAKRMLAALYLRRGNWENAVGLLEPLTRGEAPDSAALRLLASAYMRGGRYDKATEQLERLAATARPVEAQQARGILGMLGYGSKSDDGQPAADAGGGPDEVTKGLALVLDYLRNGEFAPARTEIDRLRKLAADNPVVANLDGGVALAAGDRAGARQRFEEALKLSPDYLPALDNLSRLDYGDGNLDAVEQRYRASLARQPGSELLIQRLVGVLMARKQPDQARSFLETKLAALPKSLGLRQLLISLYLQERRPEDAARVARELLAANATSAPAVELAGRVLLQAGKVEDAAGAFRSLQELTPTAIGPRLLLAQTLVRAGKVDQARQVLDQVRRLDKGAVPAVSALVELAIGARQFDQALALANSLEATDPVAAVRLTANVEIRQGTPAKAAATLAAAIERHPEPALVADLFRVRRQAGETEAATAGLRSWLAGRPDDREIRRLLADSLLEGGDLKGAALEYGVLLARDAGNPVLLNNLAWVNFELNRPGALDLARRAYALAPRSADVADTLGWLLTRSGQTEEGVRLLRDATASQPANPTLQYHLAFALDAAGKPGEARQLLETLLADPKPFAERAQAEEMLTRLKRS